MVYKPAIAPYRVYRQGEIAHKSAIVLARCNQDNTEVESDTNRDKPSIIAVMAEGYQQEDWVSRYNSALTELEQAKMLGRITSAQDAIVDRLEKLRMMPDLGRPQSQNKSELRRWAAPSVD